VVVAVPPAVEALQLVVFGRPAGTWVVRALSGSPLWRWRVKSPPASMLWITATTYHGIRSALATFSYRARFADSLREICATVALRLGRMRQDS
jgi:hypothetical protein